MDDVPDYAAYSEEQLQDALAHINRERFPANFAALQHEIERRANELSSPEVEPSSSNSSERGCRMASGGCLGGTGIGWVAAYIWYSIAAANLKAAGISPTSGDGWLGIIFLIVPIFGVVGLLIGISRSRRG